MHFLLGDVEPELEAELQHDWTELAVELVDDICLRPGICPNWRSSGAVMVAAVTSALAPGYVVTTSMVGKSTCGSAETASSW